MTFAVREFRALWGAQITSVAGDQLARVALTILVYNRTRSALLAAVTFAVSIVPVFLGGVFLAGIGDRWPRRRVMVSCDVIRIGLVAIMALPGMPIASLLVLLFVVTFLEAPFRSARTAMYPDILHDDLFVLGQTISLTTYQVALVVGFALGGVVVTALGTRTSLIVDAATFAVSALIVRTGVREHAPQAAAAGHRPSPLADAREGARLVFRTPDLRTPMLLGWLCAFYNVPEGIAAPLARVLHGGPAAVGIILAAGAFGKTISNIAYSRLLSPSRRAALMVPFAIFCCATLALFVFGPDLALALAILTGSGLLDGYQTAASSAFVTAAPRDRRAQAIGLAQAGMNLGQGTAIVLAGAAASYVSPQAVIAVAGALGAVAALVIRLTSPDRSRLPNVIAHGASPPRGPASIVCPARPT